MLCGSVPSMRRAKAMTVIIALLAIPLALLARSEPCEQTQCMCCLMQARSSQPGQHKMCGGSTDGHMSCGMGNHRHAPDYGLIAPMAPTRAASLAVLIVPNIIQPSTAPQSQTISSGFQP